MRVKWRQTLARIAAIKTGAEECGKHYESSASMRMIDAPNVEH